MGFKKDAFKVKAHNDAENTGNPIVMKAVENAPAPDIDDGETVKIKLAISKKNYAYIKLEATRTGIPISSMTAVLIDEAIKERKITSKGY